VRPACRALLALVGLIAPACTPDLEAVTVTPLTTPPGDAGASASGIALRDGVGIAVRIAAYTDDPSDFEDCSSSVCSADPCAADACDPSQCDNASCSAEPCSVRACDPSLCDLGTCDPDPCAYGSCSPDECVVETTCDEGPEPVPPESLRFAIDGRAIEVWGVEPGVVIVVGRGVGSASIVVTSDEADGAIEVPVEVRAQ
jgi:hypothetical protein